LTACVCRTGERSFDKPALSLTKDSGQASRKTQDRLGLLVLRHLIGVIDALHICQNSIFVGQQDMRSTFEMQFKVSCSQLCGNRQSPNKKQKTQSRKLVVRQRGFTLVELVMTITIVGILAAVVAPRLSDNSIFQSRGFADQVQASLRYAQKIAIAQHRFVCVSFGTNNITLTIGASPDCGAPLVSTGDSSYVITAPSGIAFGTSPAPANFNFNALGKPSFATAQSITVSGYASAITVEAETG
jgi:MSHA pilin protein MshC